MQRYSAISSPASGVLIYCLWANWSVGVGHFDNIIKLGKMFSGEALSMFNSQYIDICYFLSVSILFAYYILLQGWRVMARCHPQQLVKNMSVMIMKLKFAIEVDLLNMSAFRRVGARLYILDLNLEYEKFYTIYYCHRKVESLFLSSVFFCDIGI